MLETSLGLVAFGAGATALAACGGDDDSVGSPINDAWEARASELEGLQGSVYTATQPGPWAGKEGGHVPAITAAGAVTVNHGQTIDQPDTEDHWITTIYVRDQDGVVIHLIELDGTEEAPDTSFAPPAGVTQMTAYAYCNLHGLWRSDPVAL